MITATLFALGVAVWCWGSRMESRFDATPGQLACAAVVIVALVVLAFAIPFRLRLIERVAPSPWLVPVMFRPAWLSQWVSVAAWCVVAAALVALIAVPRLGAAHRPGVAAGALMTYAWVAFPHRPGGVGPVARADPVDLVGNTVFALFAWVLIVLAAGPRVLRERVVDAVAGRAFRGKKRLNVGPRR